MYNPDNFINTHPNIVDIAAADFVKQRNPNLTFKAGEIPSYINMKVSRDSL